MRPSASSAAKRIVWGIDEYDIAKQGLVSHHVWIVDGGVERFSTPYRYVWPSELDLLAELADMRLRDLGRKDDLVAAVEVAPRTPWVDAVTAIAGSEPARAADILERLSCRTGEAYTRLRAAEALMSEGRRGDAEAELDKALAFYRQSRATAYLREAEALRGAIPDRAEHDHLNGRTSTNR